MENKKMSRDELLQQDPELVTIDDLNNFYCKCPGGLKREMLQRQTGTAKIQQSVREELEAMRFPLSRFSNVYLSGTKAEFFAAIDAAIIEAGLKPEEIERDIHVFCELTEEVFSNESASVDKKALQKEAYRKLQGALLPVYKVLRKNGYNHQELIS